METTTSLSFLFFCPSTLPRPYPSPHSSRFRGLGERRGCTSLFKRPPSPRYFYIPRRGTTIVFVPFVFVLSSRALTRGEGRGTAEVAICYNLLYRYRGFAVCVVGLRPRNHRVFPSFHSTFPPSSSLLLLSLSLSLSLRVTHAAPRHGQPPLSPPLVSIFFVAERGDIPRGFFMRSPHNSALIALVSSRGSERNNESELGF